MAVFGSQVGATRVFFKPSEIDGASRQSSLDWRDNPSDLDEVYPIGIEINGAHVHFITDTTPIDLRFRLPARLKRVDYESVATMVGANHHDARALHIVRAETHISIIDSQLVAEPALKVVEPAILCRSPSNYRSFSWAFLDMNYVLEAFNIFVTVTAVALVTVAALTLS